MSFFSPPSPPDPNQVSGAQAGYNLQAAKEQQGLNSYNQTNPYGSQTYTADASSPSGYSINTSLSPSLQGIFGSNTGTAGKLASSFDGLYSQPYDLNAATGQTAKLLNNWNQQYLSPIFGQQQSNLNSQLQNQGLAPGSAAYNNAQNLLARNQGDITNQYLTQNEGQAFNQALQNYQLPLQTEAGLLGATPNTTPFAATPTEQIQPPNYTGAAYNTFNAQQNQYQNMIGGIGQLAGVALAPFTGGLSALPGMFAGGWGSSAGNIAK